MIEGIRLRNFKAHTDTAVRLERLSVLIGPNGSGKTSILQSAYLLSQCIDTLPSKMFGPGSDHDLAITSRKRSETTVSIGADGRTDDENYA